MTFYTYIRLFFICPSPLISAAGMDIKIIVHFLFMEALVAFGCIVHRATPRLLFLFICISLIAVIVFIRNSLFFPSSLS